MSLEQPAGKRIIVIGSSNAGKSTLAERLAQRLSVPFIELDALHWEPGWQTAEREVFRERVRRATAPESWVIAGNYLAQQQDVSWPRADTIIWLDLGLHTLLRRCVARSWRRYRSQELLWDSNRENFWEHLMLWDTDRSLLAYTVRYHHARQRERASFPGDPRWAHLTFIRLRSADEADRWLASIPARVTYSVAGH